MGALSRGRLLHTTMLAASAAVLLASAATADVRTTADGVYTAEQARSGQGVHERHCAKCHLPSYYQGTFLQSWQNQPVSALYDVIRLSMPMDRPGALRPREYASLLAYVLELNQMPAGDERLGHEQVEMRSILIDTSQ